MCNLDDDCLPLVSQFIRLRVVSQIFAAGIHWVAYCFRLIGVKRRHMTTTTRAAIYARVSTSDQTCENQLLELRCYCEARGWQAESRITVSGATFRTTAVSSTVNPPKKRSSIT
jgi:hypothetical protein